MEFIENPVLVLIQPGDPAPFRGMPPCLQGGRPSSSLTAPSPPGFGPGTEQAFWSRPHAHWALVGPHRVLLERAAGMRFYTSQQGLLDDAQGRANSPTAPAWHFPALLPQQPRLAVPRSRTQTSRHTWQIPAAFAESFVMLRVTRDKRKPIWAPEPGKDRATA